MTNPFEFDEKLFMRGWRGFGAENGMSWEDVTTSPYGPLAAVKHIVTTMFHVSAKEWNIDIARYGSGESFIIHVYKLGGVLHSLGPGAIEDYTDAYRDPEPRRLVCEIIDEANAIVAAVETEAERQATPVPNDSTSTSMATADDGDDREAALRETLPIATHGHGVSLASVKAAAPILTNDWDSCCVEAHTDGLDTGVYVVRDGPCCGAWLDGAYETEVEAIRDQVAQTGATDWDGRYPVFVVAVR